jgi:hypothetical protein
MVVMRSNFAALVIALVAATSAGCSADPEDVAKSGSAACAGGERRVPEIDREVSFGREVLPILQASCSFVSCHGSPGRNGLYLGPNGPSDASTIRAALLENTKTASMPFVTPGKPDRSWLLRKLDGNFCGVTCEGSCGERMPKSGDPLDPAKMSTIATWIANGAPDN